MEIIAFQYGVVWLRFQGSHYEEVCIHRVADMYTHRPVHTTYTADSFTSFVVLARFVLWGYQEVFLRKVL